MKAVPEERGHPVPAAASQTREETDLQENHLENLTKTIRRDHRAKDLLEAEKAPPHLGLAAEADPEHPGNLFKHVAPVQHPGPRAVSASAAARKKTKGWAKEAVSLLRRKKI